MSDEQNDALSGGNLPEKIRIADFRTPKVVDVGTGRETDLPDDSRPTLGEALRALRRSIGSRNNT